MSYYYDTYIADLTNNVRKADPDLEWDIYAVIDSCPLLLWVMSHIKV